MNDTVNKMLRQLDFSSFFAGCLVYVPIYNRDSVHTNAKRFIALSRSI